RHVMPDGGSGGAGGTGGTTGTDPCDLLPRAFLSRCTGNFADFAPTVAADDNGTVIVAWTGRLAWQPRNVNMYAVSRDYGASFGEPQRIDTPMTLPQYPEPNAFDPVVVADRSGNFYLVWQGSARDEARDTETDKRIWLARFQDGAFVDPREISDPTTERFRAQPWASTDANGRVLVTWAGLLLASLPGRVAFRAIAEGGLAPDPTVTIDDYYGNHPRTCVDATRVGAPIYVAYYRFPPGAQPMELVM